MKINYGFKYAIFDMDGTLIDSMKYWYDLGRDYLISKGKEPAPEVSEAVANMTMTESAEYFIKNYGIADGVVSQQNLDAVISEINLLIEENYRSHIQLKPGVYEYLQQMYRAGIKMCIATTTSEYLAELVCERTGIRAFFSFILSSDEIGIGKHSPEIYYEAVRRLHASETKSIERDNTLKDTIVYEDAEYAIRTVLDAGMNCVIVQDDYQGRIKSDLCNRSCAVVNVLSVPGGCGVDRN